MLAVLVLACIFCSEIKAVLISQSQLAQSFGTQVDALTPRRRVTRCLNDGTEPLRCSKKMVLTLGVSSTGPTEGIVGTATQDDGSSVLLGTPIRVSIAKSSPKLRFPIGFVQVIYLACLVPTVKTVCSDGDSRHELIKLATAEGEREALRASD
jgi:hypothetical protein